MDFSTSESQTQKKKQILDKESSESLDSPKNDVNWPLKDSF